MRLRNSIVRQFLVLVVLLCTMSVSAATGKYADIRKYGASQKNPEHNAEALEKAIASGKTVYIPRGVWVLSRTVQLGRSNVSLTGVKGKSFLKVTSPQGIIQTNPGIKNLSISNIVFRGVGDKRVVSFLILVQHSSSGITVLNCTFDGGTGGLLINYESSHVLVEGCRFRNMVYVPGAGEGDNGERKIGGAGGYGVVFQQMSKSGAFPNGARGVNHGVIRYCTFEATVMRHATYVQSSDNIKVYNNIAYGTSEMNDSTLLNDLVTVGLTQQQIDSIDVKKHMTKYDLPFEFRGGNNILVKNNRVYGGIGFSNGMTDAVGDKGENFTFTNNKAYNIHTQKGMLPLNVSYMHNPKSTGNTFDNR